MLKTCVRCLVEQPIENYSIGRKNKGGRRPTCKNCIRLLYLADIDRIKAQSLSFREANREKLRERTRAYNAKNKDYGPLYRERTKEQTKQRTTDYYTKNQAKLVEKSAIYRKENKQLVREYDRKYKLENKEALALYRLNTKEKYSEWHKAYYAKNKETINAKGRQWRLDNIDRSRKNMRERVKRKRKNDNQFRLACCLRGRLRGYLSLKGLPKVGSAIRNLGCDIQFLKEYLEKQFTKGMTWDNSGNKKGQWSLDHIMPLSAFDLTDKQHLALCCHYGNIRPMWAADNIRKGKKIPDVYGQIAA